jgi:cyanate permease
MIKFYLLSVMFLTYIILSVLVKRKQRLLGISPAKETSNAVWVGVFWVNVPILPILLTPLFVQKYMLSNNDASISVLCFLLGFIGAWLWWSINVSLWRRWSARKGVDPNELQNEGQSSSILWPRGHFFERTEFDNIVKRLRK